MHYAALTSLAPAPCAAAHQTAGSVKRNAMPARRLRLIRGVVQWIAEAICKAMPRFSNT